MANKLILETSPYLLQHKDNPVDWLAWNDNTLSLVNKGNVPVLLSIGYSACHWCHVMAHESFEDVETAKIMNEHFINIKVDREERPDLDAYYQTALSLLGVQGGWPLTMFLDNETKPFWGGTYFPKEQRFGLIAFKDVLLRISKTYANNKDAISHNSKLLNQAVGSVTSSSVSKNYNNKVLEIVFKSIHNNIDFENGGIKGGMKFPQFPLFKTCFAGFKKFNLKDNFKKTLLSQCLGGIYDHVGGGVSRYTVDEAWLVPHFEKMLYDNACFVEALSYPNPDPFLKKYFKHKINKTLSWLNEDMCEKNKRGVVYYSAIDADSEGVEGKYYVWTFKELLKIFGKDVVYLEKEFGATKEGNWEKNNILNRLGLTSGVQLKNEISNKSICVLKRLNEFRKKRIPPQKDKKILSDWNLMLCSALIRAYKSFGDVLYLKRAKEIILFFNKMMVKNKNLHHSYCQGVVGSQAFLTDFSYLIKVYLDFYSLDFEKKYLSLAVKKTDLVLKKFLNKDQMLFYYRDVKDPGNNPACVFDSATQSGGGIMLENLIRLYNYLGNIKYLNIVDGCLKLSWENITKNPIGFSSYIHATNLVLNSHHIVVIKGDKKNFEKIRRLLVKSLVFNTCVFVNEGVELEKTSPAYGKKKLKNKTTVYICSMSVCYDPITSYQVLSKKLGELPFL